MFNKQVTKIAIVGAFFSIFAAQHAVAGGFLADTFVKPFNPGLAKQLDDANARLGNPVDHAIAAGANVIVPGSGTALEAGWAIQRSGVLNPPPGFNQGMPQPMPPQGLPPGFPVPSPVGFPGSMPMQMPMGNICATPMGGFPGPFNPVGMPCMTPVGPGVVVQAMR